VTAIVIPFADEESGIGWLGLLILLPPAVGIVLGARRPRHWRSLRTLVLWEVSTGALGGICVLFAWAVSGDAEIFAVVLLVIAAIGLPSAIIGVAGRLLFDLVRDRAPPASPS
jgi:hypothetical protein